MASIFKRKADAAAQITDTRAKLADIAAKMGDLSKRRAELLLEGDDMVPVLAIDDEVAAHQRNAAALNQRISLLQGQLDQAERERRAKEQAAHIGRVAKKLDELVVVAAEMSELTLAEERVFRKWLKLSDEVSAAWSWSVTDRIAGNLTDARIVEIVKNDRFRIGAQPFVGGDNRTYRPSLPGGKSPDLRLLGLPEGVKPLHAVMQESVAYLKQLMRGGVAPEPAKQEAIDLAPAEALTPNVAGPKRSAAEIQAGMSKVTLATH
jgi:hypothetical protein